jgi:hypothetical protein
MPTRSEKHGSDPQPAHSAAKPAGERSDSDSPGTSDTNLGSSGENATAGRNSGRESEEARRNEN